MTPQLMPTYRGEAAARWVADLNGARPSAADQAADGILRDRVAGIIAEVAAGGDAALAGIAERLGDPPPRVLLASDEEVWAAGGRLPRETKDVLRRAAHNIRVFAEAVMGRLREPVVVRRPECECGVRFQPVARAACYVPGGRYPLPSTALMTALTARVAGVEDVVLVTPRPRDEILYAGQLAGVRSYCFLGGAQAVAAMALGTETIPRADLIVGPGNAYVTEAKRQLLGQVGIDMLAGPSEIVVVADSEADPRWVALDLLAQAEHDPDARAYLLTDSPALCEAVAGMLPQLLRELQLPDFVRTALRGGALVVLPDLPACLSASEHIAPEHLQLHLRDPDAAMPALRNFGAVFLGDESPVPYGDYMAGPNHTLPTRRTARFCGALTPMTFLRAQSWVRAGEAAAQLSLDTEHFADLEGLSAHAAAARARRPE